MATAGIDAPHIDERVLGRVQALLAKAQSTDFPEEAEALTAKAHELMARYAIDHVQVDDGRGPRLHEVAVDPPYASAKFVLLGGIARANRCRAIWSKHDGSATVVGYPIDVETVEVLYTSLLVQVTSAMLAHGAQADAWGRSRTKAFRHSFLLAFASRVGQRLAEQTAAAEDEAVTSTGTDLVPLLSARATEVERAVGEAFPHLARHRVSASSADGLVAGRAAADRADLSRRGGRLAS